MWVPPATAGLRMPAVTGARTVLDALRHPGGTVPPCLCLRRLARPRGASSAAPTRRRRGQWPARAASRPCAPRPLSCPFAPPPQAPPHRCCGPAQLRAPRPPLDMRNRGREKLEREGVPHVKKEKKEGRKRKEERGGIRGGRSRVGDRQPSGAGWDGGEEKEEGFGRCFKVG